MICIIKRLFFIVSLFILNGCGEIISTQEYSSVKGAELSWTNKINISASNISTYTVAGRCVPQFNDVTVSIGNPVLAQQILPCINGFFNGTMNLGAVGLPEGSTEVSANQVSLTANALVQVLVDTIIPIAPTIVTPVNGSSTSTSSVSVTGSCVNGNTVNLSGDFLSSPLNVNCISSSYVSAINLILGNGPKIINATQTDLVGNISPAATSNINLGILPLAATVTSPANGMLTNLTTQNIIGACETGATVNIAGDVIGSPVLVVCMASSYNQAVTLTALNGIKNFSVSQTNGAGTSPVTNRTLNLDTAAPAAPTITSPTNGSLTNLTAQNIIGACETGSIVNISGAIVGSPLTASCLASAYSRAVTLISSDGLKAISATQTDPAGNTSVATNISVTLDQIAPLAPSITSPVNGSLTNSTVQTLVGACETGATVNISGALVGSPVTTVCAASAYSRAVTLTAANGAKAISATQTDPAGNTSVATNTSITLDNIAPLAPTITSPPNGSFTNTTPKTIIGACETGSTVNISGAVVGSPVTTSCVSSAYSRAVTLTAGDGAKAISATQTDVANNTSTATNISINLDTVAPAAPTITTPTNSSFVNTTSITIIGACTSGLPVDLTGNFTPSPVSVGCVASSYSRSVTLSAVDGVKTISATQTDLAGNTSAATNISITLDRVIPAAPTITSPVSGITTNTTSQTITGACETDSTVNLTGGILGAPVTVLCVASGYSQAVTLTAAYGSKTITASQTDRASNTSATVSIILNYTNLDVTYPATFTGPKYTPLNFPAAGIAATIVTGTPTSYSITPALPTGLSLNATSGLISGTPNISDDAGRSYTITINDAIGTIQRVMFLRVAIPDYTWMGTAGDGLWTTPGNWRINMVPPTTAFTYFDDECLVSGNCNASANANTQVLRLYMKPTYTGIITQNPGITFRVGSGSSNGGSPNTWGKWEMEAGTFIGGNSALTIDRINIQGGAFTSTSGVLTLGSNFTYQDCSTGGPVWDWKGSRDCGFTLAAAAMFNHNNGIFHVLASTNAGGSEVFKFWLDQILNIQNLIFEINSNGTPNVYDGRYNSADAWIAGTSKIINVTSSLDWRDGNLSYGEIRYQGLTANFECDTQVSSNRCSDLKFKLNNFLEPENTFSPGTFQHTFLKLNRNDGNPQTITFDDGAAIPGINLDNPNGLNLVENGPNGYLRLGKLTLTQGLFTAPKHLSFGSGTDTHASGSGNSAYQGLYLNGGTFAHNNGLVSFDSGTIYSDIFRGALEIRATSGITFNNVMLNIAGDFDLDDGINDGYKLYLTSGTTVNILGDLDVKNGYFSGNGPIVPIFNIHGDINFYCTDVPTKDCYGKSDFIYINLIGSSDALINIEPNGPIYIAERSRLTINKSLQTNRVTLIGNGGLSSSSASSPLVQISSGIFDLGIYDFNHAFNFVNNGAVQCTVGTGYFQYLGSISGTPQPGNQPMCYGP